MEHKPTSREAALLLLRSVEERGDRRGKELTRARLSSLTLKQLFKRESLNESWLAEVNEWLLSAGWTLFKAGDTFALVRTSVVRNWPRVAAKHLNDVLERVAQGRFDFSKIDSLLEEKGSRLSTGLASPSKKGDRHRNATS